MNLRLQYIWYITIFAGVIVLCEQLLHFQTLYKQKKSIYTHEQNAQIRNTIDEFNAKSTNVEKTGNILSFDAKNNILSYLKEGNISRYQLDSRDNISEIRTRAVYDLKDPELWTLSNFYQYLQAKQDSSSIQSLVIQFFIQDSTDKIKDAYPKQVKQLPSSFEYSVPLGFISKDTLFATYHYPVTLFLQAASWQITIIILIATILILCIINLYLSFRNEKRSRENQEQYIHHIVHDLKRPVENQIKANYLLRHLQGEAQAKIIEQRERESKEMLRSINRMLLQSTDAHGLRLNPKEFNLQEMIETLAQPDRWSVEEGKRFHIRSRFLVSDKMITGDPNFLHAVFQNLIDNSLKYSKEQTEIIITCSDSGDKHVRIEIKDNGLGISPEALKHIFERYHRGDHQGNKKIKGHGQGLYYVRQIIKAHRGKINIESTLGEGTTIIITLPKNIKKKNH